MAISTLEKKFSARENNFFARYYAYFLWGLMSGVLGLLVMLLMVTFQLTHRPLPAFKAVAPNEQQMNLAAFQEPNLLPETILRFASKAATVAYTFDLYNYENQLSAARPYFTEQGWRDYLGSVKGLLQTIVKNQLFAYGVVSGTPVISNQGEYPGKGYTWRVQIPFLVTYASASASSTKSYYVVLTLVRVPTSVNPQGIGVDQFLMV